MATLKFKEKSPYQKEAAPASKLDYVYYKHLDHLQLEFVEPPKRHGVALFGAGRAGTIHIMNLIKNARVRILYIIDDDKVKLNKLKTYWNLPNTQFITNAESDKVFKDPNVEFVLVASPTFTHEEIVTKALNSDKAVFCEKPVAQNLEKIRALYTLAKKVNKPLLCAFNRRFDPAYTEVRRRVHSGDIGMVLTIKVCSRDSPLPSLDYLKISGGIFHDCGVHDIDMILYVLGEYPNKVSVLANANIPEIAKINDYDTVAVTLSFPSGAIAMIDLSRLCVFGYDQRLEVFGQKGMLKVENRQPLHNIEHYTGENVSKSPINYSFPSRYEAGYEDELDHFLDVLEGKTELLVDSKDTLAVAKIAAACEESVRTGKVVELKWSKEDLE